LTAIFAPEYPLKAIDDRLRAEIEDALFEANIKRLGSYGWVGPNDPNPDFVGLAMWHVEPAIDNPDIFFVGRASFGKSQIHEQGQWLKALAVSAADFEGLMESARISIGMLLIQAKLLDQVEFKNDDLFDLHHLSSIIYLSTAADRLRAFVIAAAFRISIKSYGKKFGTNYKAAFEQCAKQFGAAYEDCLSKLLTMVEEIVRLRRNRNELIHQLATSIGRQERQRLDQPPKSTAVPDFSVMQEHARRFRMERQAHRAEIIRGLSRSYILLVQAVSEAFVFENRRRREAV